MPEQTSVQPWPFGPLAPGSYRMWSSGDGWGDAVITEGGRLLVRQLDRDGTYGDDWHDMTSIYRTGIEWEFERVAPHPLMPIPAEARARVAELTAELDESRGDAGRAHGQAGALLARVVELQAQVTARDARVAELEAQRDRVRQLHQPIEAVNMRHPGGRLTRVCSGCGTDDGNWQPYPCPTIRALGENR